jgi:hypothetical protein
MKKPLHLFVALFAGFIFLSAFHQRPAGPLEDVVNALKSGNVAGLSKYFDNTIEISLPEKSDSYSRTQAEMVLKDFFDTKGIKNFESQHQGNNNGSQYCIGTLITKSGNYRTTVYMKQKTDRSLLQELRIELKR